ncbi:bestrophin family ion channel [Phaeobacter sp. NW0010-22]|uniref:bestrophin family protein n=1 Tax=Phaeobacter sp. NW0010-22 TaxID=3135907 RepID=UPI003107E1D4
MIVRDEPGLWALTFAMRGSVLPKILPRIAVVTGISIALVWFDHAIWPIHLAGAAPFAVFGVALSLFLGFRNNAAYDRWWEARKLWGQLIADCRAYARELDVFVSEVSHRHTLLRLAGGFIHLHRVNLRGISPDGIARVWVDDLLDAPHPPCAALNAIAHSLRDAQKNGALDGFGAKALSERLASMALAQAGCERIATTPLPFVYSLLVHRTSLLYCLLVPLGVMNIAGWMTPVFVAVIAYVFFGLAAVTEELERPFGSTVNSLPLDAMCRVVEIALAPHLGEAAPKRMQPVAHVLS